MSKWTRPGNEGERVPVATNPIRLFPHLRAGHPGWGIEDEEITALKLFHTLDCPEICKIDYSWKTTAPQLQQQHLGSDLSVAELEQYYQLNDNAEANAIKNEGSNHSNENSYSPEGHYFTLEDFQHHSDEDQFDPELNIKLTSSDAFGFESNESHSFSVEEGQGLLPELSMNALNNLLNKGQPKMKNNGTSQSGLSLPLVSINNASINNVNVQQDSANNNNQRSLLSGNGFSMLNDASSMGFDASNDMFGFKHTTPSFSTAINNPKDEIKSVPPGSQLLAAANNGAINSQVIPSPRPSPVIGKRR